MGHPDLWQHIYTLTLKHGDTLSFQHFGIEGDEEADKLAEEGRLQHPHNETQVQKRRFLAEGRAVWAGLGLEEMFSDPENPSGGESTRTSDTESTEAPPQGGEGGGGGCSG